MVKMDSFSFGTIVISGKKYHHDIVILPDGSVYRRKGLIPSLFAHSIEMRELEKLVKAGAEVALIGKGAFNRAHLSAEAEDYAKRANLKLLVLPSPEAVEKLNQLVGQGERAGAILHITC